MPERLLDAVFFDVDDTLYSSTRFSELARERAIGAMTAAGLTVGPERLHAVLRDIIVEYHSNYPYQFDELLTRMPRESYEPVNPAMIVAAGVAAYHDTKFRDLKPFDDVPAVLRELTLRGAKLGVVTSGIPTKQAEKLLRLGLVDLFEREWIFIPEQMNLTKQDPRLWREVCKLARVKPGRTMYVGDNAVMDVDPANEAGIVTVLVHRGGKYSAVEGRTRPSHEIEGFDELDELLREEYYI